MADSNSHLTRRRFLGAAAGTVAAAGALGALPPGMAEALAEPRRRGRISEVEHVVILMQENRSFDHYYGTMRGVRGFGDRSGRRPCPAASDVFHQPDLRAGRRRLPAARSTSTPSKVDGQDLGDLAHGWDDHAPGRNGGAYNKWVAGQDRDDHGLLHRAGHPVPPRAGRRVHRLRQLLLLDPGPDRRRTGSTYWTGTIDPARASGGPVNCNPATTSRVCRWTTYPERLQAAGVSWQVYANNEVGDDGSAPVRRRLRRQPAVAVPERTTTRWPPRDPRSTSSPTAAGCQTWQPDSGQGTDVDHVLAQFIADCAAGTLPAVSWVVAPVRLLRTPRRAPGRRRGLRAGRAERVVGQPEALATTTVVFYRLRRERRLLRPRCRRPPWPQPRRQPGRRVCHSAAGPIGLGPRVPMTVDLAVEPRRLGQLRRSSTTPRCCASWSVDRRARAEHLRLAPGHLRRPDQLLRLQPRKNTSVPLLPTPQRCAGQADATQTKLPKPTPPATGAQITRVQDPGSAPGPRRCPTSRPSPRRSRPTRAR